jgi:hypothetical protein
MRSNITPNSSSKTNTQLSQVDDLSSQNMIDDSQILSLFDEKEQTATQKITAEQEFNEAIIKLLVLLYQIDGKVTLTEQDMFEDILATLDWRSGVAMSAFVTDAIHQARVAIDQGGSRELLFTLGNGLNVDPAKALELAMDITEVDGNRSEDELELLSWLSNRVLARGLVD